MEKEDVSDERGNTERSTEEIAGSKYYLLDTSGRYIEELDLGTFIKPLYADCNGCPFAPKNGGTCDDFLADADCVIERTMYDVIVQSLSENAIDDELRLDVFPLAQQLFRLIRLYKLEQQIDLTKLWDIDERGNSPTMVLYEKLIKMIDQNDKGFIQKKKELSITRKEKLTRRKNKADQKSLADVFKQFTDE